jgi:hypothetical protein
MIRFVSQLAFCCGSKNHVNKTTYASRPLLFQVNESVMTSPNDPPGNPLLDAIGLQAVSNNDDLGTSTKKLQSEVIRGQITKEFLKAA